MTKTIKNMHVPVNRLPPEVLSMVLQHRDHEQDLIAATHVCQYWRSTLISDPMLWTSLQLEYNADWISRYLERSKSAAINIRMPVHPPSSTKKLKLFSSAYIKNKITRHERPRSLLQRFLHPLVWPRSILGTSRNAF